jgi:hypothetical protein
MMMMMMMMMKMMMMMMMMKMSIKPNENQSFYYAPTMLDGACMLWASIGMGHIYR